MAVKWSKGWAQEIMKSDEVLADVRNRANRVADAAGLGFTPSAMIGRNRARASVITDSFAARKKNSRQNTLIRALEAGRGG